MKSLERGAWVALTVALLIALLANQRHARPPQGANRPRTQPGVRISMDALHQQGGVPIGWQLTLAAGDPAAGREVYVDSGCPSCHHIAGESFTQADGTQAGPDLSGMGGHHPPAYFAEAILNPDAVLIEGPGYIGPDGRSTMPLYAEMTLGQLSDVVAYLASQTPAGTQSCHASGAVASVLMSSLDLDGRPPPPAAESQRFFTQTYDVLPGQLGAFERWFASEGRAQFLAVDGLLGIATFVDATRSGTGMTSVFAFRDEAALRNFMGDPGSAELWSRFDSYVGPHGHLSSDRPPVYRVASLSTE